MTERRQVPAGSIQHQSRPKRVDMVASNPWGELTAIRPGMLGWWLFRCPNGTETSLHGQTVRQQAKLGTPVKCKCERCK